MSPEFLSWLSDQTTTVTLIAGLAFVYVKFILPRQQQQEIARESSFQKVLTETLEENRKVRAEALEREERLTDMHQAQMTAQERRHAEDRAADRQMHRETIAEFSAAVRDNTVAIRKGSALTLALGEHLNVSRADVAHKASTFIGETINSADFDTKDVK